MTPLAQAILAAGLLIFLVLAGFSMLIYFLTKSDKDA